MYGGPAKLPCVVWKQNDPMSSAVKLKTWLFHKVTENEIPWCSYHSKNVTGCLKPSGNISFWNQRFRLFKDIGALTSKLSFIITWMSSTDPNTWWDWAWVGPLIMFDCSVDHPFVFLSGDAFWKIRWKSYHILRSGPLVFIKHNNKKPITYSY